MPNVSVFLRPTLRAQVAGQGILLTEAVIATDCKINECTGVLKQTGAQEVWVASIARAGMGRPEDEE